MAAPTVAGTPATTSDQTASLSHSVNLPASIAAGETLVVVVASKALTGEAAITGWTRFADVALVTGSNASLHAFWKKATGSEGATATLTFTTTSTRVAVIAYRVTGATDPTVTPPEATTASLANSINPDPPSITPSGGPKDFLIFAGFSSSHGRITSAVPTNYGSGQTAGPNNGTATNIGGGVAQRALTAATTEDPGTFTTTGTAVEETASVTIAIHPAAAGGTNWTATPSDAFGLTDARTFARSKGVADTFGLTDTRVLGQMRALQDAFGLTDARTPSRGIGQAVADVLGLTDGTTRTSGKGVSVADAFGLTDARRFARLSVLADALGLTDARSFARLLVRADLLGLTDLATPTLTGGGTAWTRSPADAFGLTDARAFTLAYRRTVADAFALTDTRTFARGYARALADLLGLGDAAIPVLTGAGAITELPPFDSLNSGATDSEEQGRTSTTGAGVLTGTLSGRMGNG